MHGIEIPEHQIAPLEAIAHGVVGLRIVFVNVFGLTNDDGTWVLVDCGPPHSAKPIADWAEKHFYGPPEAIMLTHGHFDHVGSAVALSEEWKVPIYAHPSERDYLTGQKEYSKPNVAAGGGLMTLLSPLLPRSPYNLGERLRFFSSSYLSELPNWRILSTPGHTPGHVSLYRQSDGILLPGDAFCTTKAESFFEAAIAQDPELHGPPAYFTSNWTAAGKSVQFLSSLDVAVVAPGHGRPLRGDNLSAKLKEMSDRFTEIAVPDNRKPSAA